MSDDASYSDLRDALWYQLACRCQRCETELDLGEVDHLKDRDAMAWSRIAAERASEQGWQALVDKIGVLCPACAAGTD